MTVIPFYGADDPAMFAIERAAMDRDGHVVRALDELLPRGRVLDVGAGDGFTAERLCGDRYVVALEPSAAMVAERPIAWVRGDAEHLPFADASTAPTPRGRTSSRGTGTRRRASQSSIV